MDQMLDSNLKARVIEDAIRAYGRHIEEVLIRGELRQPIEFFADYARMLRDGDVHDCTLFVMVNGSCSICGKLMINTRTERGFTDGQ